MPVENYYYVNSSRQPVGPLKEFELDALIKAGVVQPETPVILEGAAEWSTAQQLNLIAAIPQKWSPPALSSSQVSNEASENYTWIIVLVGIGAIALTLILWLHNPWFFLFMVIVGLVKGIGSWVTKSNKRKP